MTDSGLRIREWSGIYRTPCFPEGAGADFANAVAAIETDLAPRDILSLLHEIEAEFGRERLQRWGQRVLDLDLLALGDLVLPDGDTFLVWRNLPLDRQMNEAPSELILPHPRLHERAFVLVPLNEVAPDWRHPVLGSSVSEMLTKLPESEKTAVRRWQPAAEPD
jgi:2-amino-4-hydroxy-6-hydroxymethyldihydropteridine diphosphokinase